MAVTAGRYETGEGRAQIRIGQIVCRDVRRDVVHARKGQACGIGERFCIVQADEQRADQSRPVRDRDPVQRVKRYPRLRQRPIHDRADHLDMAARGDLRHYAAVDLVQRDLRVYHVGQHDPAVFHDRRRSLVAARLNGEQTAASARNKCVISRLRIL